jgi:hypothetical protein
MSWAAIVEGQDFGTYSAWIVRSHKYTLSGEARVEVPAYLDVPSVAVRAITRRLVGDTGIEPVTSTVPGPMSRPCGSLMLGWNRRSCHRRHWAALALRGVASLSGSGQSATQGQPC